MSNPLLGFGKPKTTQRLSSSGRGVLIAIIGVPGIGKSSCLSFFPKVKFICDCRDQGIRDLVDYSEHTGVTVSPSDILIADNYEMMESSLSAEVEGEAETIVLESMVGFQALCDDQCMEKDYSHFGEDRKKSNFQNYRNGLSISANTYLQHLLDLMIKGQNNGKNLFFTGHTKVGTAKAVEGEDWVSSVLQIGVEHGRRIDAAFANIFHIGQTLTTHKPTGSKVRPNGNFQYKVFVSPNPLFPGKNRMHAVDFDFPETAKEAYNAICNACHLNPKTGRRF